MRQKPSEGDEKFGYGKQSIAVPQRPELTTEHRQTLKGKIVEYMFQLQKDGASKTYTWFILKT